MPRSLARNVRVSHASFIHVQPGRRSKSWSTVSIKVIQITSKNSNARTSAAIPLHYNFIHGSKRVLTVPLSEPSIAACTCSCLLALRRRGDADCWVAARNFITSAHLLSTAIARLLLGHDRLMAAQVVVTWRCNARAAHLSMGCSRVLSPSPWLLQCHDGDKRLCVEMCRAYCTHAPGRAKAAQRRGKGGIMIG